MPHAYVRMYRLTRTYVSMNKYGRDTCHDRMCLLTRSI